MTRLVLINPNTDPDVTRAMAEIARAALAGAATLEILTAPFGSRLILDAAGLAMAEEAVLALGAQLAAGDWDGVIIAAFADPAVFALRQVLAIPVTGIAEAGMAAAAGKQDRPFAVVTTTPGLAPAITAAALRYGYADLYRGTILTAGDPLKVMADPDLLVEALEQACETAMRDLDAQALIIGGGPLAQAARRLSSRVKIPLIEPVPAAARLALSRAGRRV